MRFINIIFAGWLWCVLISGVAQAQDIVELIRFDSARLTSVNGERVQILVNARLSMREITMVSDSAYRYLDRDEMHAYGNIQIDTDTENIWADTLIYFSNRDISLLRGRVVILQDSTTLFGHKVDYNFETKEAVFPDGIRLEDGAGTLVAKQGAYFQEQDSAIFRLDVQVQDTSQYIEGDSLFINRKSEYYQIYNNVFISDSTSNALLTGHYLEADSTGRRFIRDNAYLMKVETDTAGADTMHIWAGDLLLQEQDSSNTIQAFDNVRVWSEKFSSLSDSLFFDSASERFDLSGSPKTWNKNIQLNGPYISVQLDSTEVKKLKAYQPAFAVQEDSITRRLNQLKGDTLIADFEGGQISVIQLFPNSQILYHTKNENDEPDGAMENSSPTTILFFENGELIQAKFGQNQGLFLPEYPELLQRRLDGFAWNPELRPQKPESVPQARLAPISVERPFKLPRRYLSFINEQKDD